MESSAAVALFPWRQLGALLAEEGLLTETELELALDEQRRTGRLLGQIVVDRGYVSGFSLARVLSAQHGVDLQPPPSRSQHHTSSRFPRRGARSAACSSSRDASRRRSSRRR